MSKYDNYNKVKEFHEKFGVDPVPFVKAFPLRVELIREEAKELSIALAEKDEVAFIDALTDLQYVVYGAFITLGIEDESLFEEYTGTDSFDIERLEGLIDTTVRIMFNERKFEHVMGAMRDIVYYIDGVGKALGYDLDGAFAEVHRSNMSKLGDDGKPVKRIDGKVLKGPSYTPPNLAPFVPNDE